ncbi:MAG: hypothetical protein WC933_00615 [Candidatus Paceibacterota bacterium]|jgi:predicted PurR-regulated permease PerM
MKFLEKIKGWPIEKKRIFSILLAVFLTILIIVLNSGINLLWKDEAQNKVFNKNSPINSIKESFSQIFGDVESIAKQVSSSTAQLIDQIKSASSSFSTSSN